MFEERMLLIVTPALAWLMPRKVRSRIAMKSMLKSGSECDELLIVVVTLGKIW